MSDIKKALESLTEILGQKVVGEIATLLEKRASKDSYEWQALVVGMVASGVCKNGIKGIYKVRRELMKSISGIPEVYLSFASACQLAEHVALQQNTDPKHKQQMIGFLQHSVKLIAAALIANQVL